MGATRPPLEYLLTSSHMSLESVELARLNRAANLRKELHQVVEEWIDAEVDARLARSILEWRRGETPRAHESFGDAARAEPRQLAISFLPPVSEPAVAIEIADDRTLALPEQSVGRPVPSTDERSGTRPYGFSTAKLHQRRRKSAGECLRENAQTASRAVGPLAPRHTSLSTFAVSALRQAEHLAHGCGKVLRGFLRDRAERVDDECSQCLGACDIRAARRNTERSHELRPPTPARRLLRCTLAHHRRAVAAW